VTDASVTPSLSADEAEIADVMDRLFSAFVSGPDAEAQLAGLLDLFLPEAVIVRTCGLEPAVYDVDGFIAPRRALLTSGAVHDFHEWEESGLTQVFGDIAHHFCSYAKAWVADGASLSGRGMKTLQLVRTAAGWRISAMAWDDQRDGLVVPPDATD